MSAEVIDLGPHTNMTPAEALAVAQREPWENLIMIGFHKDDGAIVVRSSHMSREFALWIVEHAKLHIMDRL